MDTNGDRQYPRLPQVAVGAIVIKDNRVLLVKRAKAPSDGQWAIPGGRVELGETLQAAAERELMEETGVKVAAGEPAYCFDAIVYDENRRVLYHYVIIDLKADYVSGEVQQGDDALEAAWISPEEIDNLPVNRTTRHVLKDVVGFLT
jgi:8-oxo-dGTP diphosphatase